MRVLLDSCVPHRLRHSLSNHDVQSARFAGLEGMLDKQLLDAMEGFFDVLVTCDQGIPWQQNMSGRSVAVLLMMAPSNRRSDLLPLVPALLDVLDDIRPGEVREVTG
jgi:predicted nuclease of predicted toxin-antitoxin system